MKRFGTTSAEPWKVENETIIEANQMKYGIAWLLGVPVSVLVIWWIVAHVL